MIVVVMSNAGQGLIWLYFIACRHQIECLHSPGLCPGAYGSKETPVGGSPTEADG